MNTTSLTIVSKRTWLLHQYELFMIAAVNNLVNIFLNDLCSIILRLWTHNFAISTDIEKTFLHINLHDEDRDYTCLENPTDPNSEFIVYRFKTVLFGAVSSPFILYATLYCHLQQHNTSLSNNIQSNLYVDNIVSGCATEAETIHYYHSAKAILSKAKFNLRA